MQLQENQLFDDRYYLVRLLGYGGFSEVWLAEDVRTQPPLKVAIKVYAPGQGLDDDGIQVFSHEFSLVFNLNHTNLLRPTHYDVTERMPYLIMPFCEHGSARKLVGKISEDEAWRFLHDVASGLAYLHSKEPPVIHQDIKPDNILIDADSAFLITDFGISSRVHSTLRKSMARMKTSGGTIAYMAPERFGANPTPVKASDVWALGATLYELMTSDVPFGEHGGLIQKSGAEIPNISGNWSPELQKIVEACLAKEAWDRPMAQTLINHGKISVRDYPALEQKQKCWKCGKEINRSAVFCSYCNVSQQVYICSKCGKQIPSTSVFCPYCGTKHRI